MVAQLNMYPLYTHCASRLYARHRPYLIFAKPFNTSSTSQNRVIYDTVTSQTSIKFYYKVFYVHLRKAQSISTSGTYGIQIKNNSNVVIFDSRSATSGMKIIGGSSGHAAAMQAGNTTGQAPVGSPILSVSGNSTIIHSGDPTNVYVSCNTGYYNVGAFGQQGNHVVIGGAVYDYSNNRIIAETYGGALVSGFGFQGVFRSRLLSERLALSRFLYCELASNPELRSRTSGPPATSLAPLRRDTMAPRSRSDGK